MTEFKYSPSLHVPFRDKKVIERVRKIKREDIDKHPNPNYKINVVKASELRFIWLVDMFCFQSPQT